MSNEFESLFTPWKVGNCEIKNRIVLEPMTGTGPIEAQVGFKVNTKVFDFYRERSTNDVGLFIPGGVTLNAIVGKKWIYECQEVFENLKPLLDDIHKNGSKMFMQVTAGSGGRDFPMLPSLLKVINNKVGRKIAGKITNFDSWLVDADDNVPNYWAHNTEYRGRAITKEEINEIVDAMGKTAAKLKEIGVDGIEIHSLHFGVLLDEFALPYLNHRTDEYGGSIENCARFACELVQEIKKTCGSDYPVAIRIGVRSYTKAFNEGALPDEEFTEIGRDIEYTKELVKILDKAGVDIFDCDNGTYESYYWCHPPVYMPLNCNLKDVEEIRKVTDKPIICAGRMEPDAAEESIASGKITAMGVGRQFLCDAEYAKKIKEGRLEDIRPCISCQACVPNTETDGHGDICNPASYSKCAQNPRIFEEKRYDAKKIGKPKKIAVIGGGIAGMECAIKLKNLGHKVDLYEKNNKLAGVFNAAAAPQFKEKDKQLIEWYKRELKKSRVNVHMNTEIKNLNELNADEIVIATGSYSTRKLNIKGNEKIIEAADYLLNKETVGDKVAVIGGGFTGCEIAYKLALDGKHPFVVENAERLLISKTACAANTLMLRDELKLNKVPVYLNSKVVEVSNGNVIIETAKGREGIPVDSVISSIGYIPGSELAKKESKHVHIIGDAKTVGNIKSAVHGANELVLKIG